MLAAPLPLRNTLLASFLPLARLGALFANYFPAFELPSPSSLAPFPSAFPLPRTFSLPSYRGPVSPPFRLSRSRSVLLRHLQRLLLILFFSLPQKQLYRSHLPLTAERATPTPLLLSLFPRLHPPFHFFHQQQQPALPPFLRPASVRQQSVMPHVSIRFSPSARESRIRGIPADKTWPKEAGELQPRACQRNWEHPCGCFTR